MKWIETFRPQETYIKTWAFPLTLTTVRYNQDLEDCKPRRGHECRRRIYVKLTSLRTVQYHPDKISSAADHSAANDFYVHLKNARDIIIDPIKRFAYDRFGPEVFQCERHCVTIRDYEIHALYITIIRYGLITSLLAAANALGYMKDGAYVSCLLLSNLHEPQLV